MAKKYRTVQFPIIAATVLVIVIGAAAAVVVKHTHDPDYWVAAATPLIPVVLAVAGKIRREANTPSLDHLDEQAKVLRKLVLKQWSKQVELRISPYTLPVPFKVVSEIEVSVRVANKAGKLRDKIRTVEVMDSWAAILNRSRLKPPALAGTCVSIAKVFGTKGLPRRLVVLGEPGGGKSILAMSLTVKLLEARPPKRETGSRHPRSKAIPVLLPLATWDPAVPLNDWAAVQMARTYPWLGEEIQMEQGSSRTLAGWLIDQGMVLMVLDGLDEISKENRLAAFERLSEVASGNQEMVITCRTREYAQIVFEAKHPMAKTPVIRLFPLPYAAVRDFLKEADANRRPRFSGLLRHIEREPTGALATALSSPLALWLVATVYRDMDKKPAELTAQDSVHDVLRHLLNGLISAVYSTQTDGLDRRDAHQVAAAQRRLARIAEYLGPDNQDIEWWRLPEKVPALFIGGLIGSLVGCVLGAAVGLAAAIRFSPHSGIQLGIVFGVVTGLLSGVTSARAQEHPRAMDLHFSWDYGRFVGCITVGTAVGITTGYADARHGGLIAGLVTAAVVGPACAAPCIREFGKAPGITAGITASIALGLSSGLSKGNGHPTLSGLAAGLVFVFAAWVFVGLFQQSTDKLVVNPRLLLDRDRLGCLIVAVTAGVAFAVVYGVALGPMLGLVAFVALTVSVSVTVSMWAAFNVSRIWLACTGMLPVQIMSFLNEAYRGGVLRQVGGSYQFRHAELKEALLEPARQPAAIASEVTGVELVATKRGQPRIAASEGSVPQQRGRVSGRDPKPAKAGAKHEP